MVDSIVFGSCRHPSANCGGSSFSVGLLEEDDSDSETEAFKDLEAFLNVHIRNSGGGTVIHTRTQSVDEDSPPTKSQLEPKYSDSVKVESNVFDKTSQDSPICPLQYDSVDLDADTPHTPNKNRNTNKRRYDETNEPNSHLNEQNDLKKCKVEACKEHSPDAVKEKKSNEDSDIPIHISRKRKKSPKKNRPVSQDKKSPKLNKASKIPKITDVTSGAQDSKLLLNPQKASTYRPSHSNQSSVERKGSTVHKAPSTIDASVAKIHDSLLSKAKVKETVEMDFPAKSKKSTEKKSTIPSQEKSHITHTPSPIISDESLSIPKTFKTNSQASVSPENHIKSTLGQTDSETLSSKSISKSPDNKSTVMSHKNSNDFINSQSSPCTPETSVVNIPYSKISSSPDICPRNTIDSQSKQLASKSPHPLSSQANSKSHTTKKKYSKSLGSTASWECQVSNTPSTRVHSDSLPLDTQNTEIEDLVSLSTNNDLTQISRHLDQPSVTNKQSDVTSPVSRKIDVKNQNSPSPTARIVDKSSSDLPSDSSFVNKPNAVDSLCTEDKKLSSPSPEVVPNIDIANDQQEPVKSPTFSASWSCPPVLNKSSNYVPTEFKEFSSVKTALYLSRIKLRHLQLWTLCEQIRKNPYGLSCQSLRPTNFKIRKTTEQLSSVSQEVNSESPAAAPSREEQDHVSLPVDELLSSPVRSINTTPELLDAVAPDSISSERQSSDSLVISPNEVDQCNQLVLPVDTSSDHAPDHMTLPVQTLDSEECFIVESRTTSNSRSDDQELLPPLVKSADEIRDLLNNNVEARGWLKPVNTGSTFHVSCCFHPACLKKIVLHEDVFTHVNEHFVKNDYINTSEPHLCYPLPVLTSSSGQVTVLGKSFDCSSQELLSSQFTEFDDFLLKLRNNVNFYCVACGAVYESVYQLLFHIIRNCNDTLDCGICFGILFCVSGRFSSVVVVGSPKVVVRHLSVFFQGHMLPGIFQSGYIPCSGCDPAAAVVPHEGFKMGDILLLFCERCHCPHGLRTSCTSGQRFVPFRNNLEDDDASIMCPVCNEVFVDLDNLLKHNEVHSQRIRCAFCTSSFSEMFDLASHLKLEHNMPSPAENHQKFTVFGYVTFDCKYSLSLTAFNNFLHQLFESDAGYCNIGYFIPNPSEPSVQDD